MLILSKISVEFDSTEILLHLLIDFSSRFSERLLDTSIIEMHQRAIKQILITSDLLARNILG